jgi:hypothetical protein
MQVQKGEEEYIDAETAANAARPPAARLPQDDLACVLKRRSPTQADFTRLIPAGAIVADSGRRVLRNG